jgi:hypothetical protein
MEAATVVQSPPPRERTICTLSSPLDYLTMSLCGGVAVLILTVLILGIRKRFRNQPLGQIIWWCSALSAWMFCYGMIRSGWIYVKSLYKLLGTDHAQMELFILNQAEALTHLLPCILISLVGITAAMILKLIDRSAARKENSL